MAGRLNPQWWDSEQPLEEAILGELARQKHRERWKYTRPQKVMDLVTLPAGDKTESRIEDLDVQALLKEAPEALYPFLQGYSIINRELANGESLNLADYGSPVQVRVAPMAEASIVRDEVEHTGSFLWLNVQAGANVTLSLNALSARSHWDSIHVQVHRDAHLTVNLHNVGADIARQDLQIQCVEPGADVTINAAASVITKGHLDQQITVQHIAPHTASRQTFHTAAGAGSNVTFNGRIHIHEECSGVDAHLSNRNLALADNATINTKPELEIYTDDVACSHGTTVGALDDAELFYCISRGLPPEIARKLLCMAFLNRSSAGPLADAARATFEGQLA